MNDVKIIDEKIIESLVLNGDLSNMKPAQKVDYYNFVCKALGLNPLTQPFKVLKLKGKEVLYASKDCTDQLRKIYCVSVIEQTVDDTFKDVGIYMVKSKMQDKDNRVDYGVGTVSINNLKGEDLANTIMKAFTKSVRRGTLSICGLGILDESEIESIPEFKQTEQTQNTLPEMTHTAQTTEDQINKLDEIINAYTSHVDLNNESQQILSDAKDKGINEGLAKEKIKSKFLSLREEYQINLKKNKVTQ